MSIFSYGGRSKAPASTPNGNNSYFRVSASASAGDLSARGKKATWTTRFDTLNSFPIFCIKIILFISVFLQDPFLLRCGGLLPQGKLRNVKSVSEKMSKYFMDILSAK